MYFKNVQFKNSLNALLVNNYCSTIFKVYNIISTIRKSIDYRYNVHID